MLELLQRLVALKENRNPITNEICWDYVDADAYYIAHSLYESNDAFYAAFNAAADMIEEN